MINIQWGRKNLKLIMRESGCLSHYFEFIIIVIIIIIIILFDLISLLFFSIFHIYSCAKHFLSSFILGSKPIGQTRFRGKGILNVLRCFLFPKPESLEIYPC